MTIKTAVIVSTGSEILQGLYADSNAQYLAAHLTAMGINVVAILAAPDEAQQLEKILGFAANAADLVICSGGLGPTEDDLNRFVFAKVWQVELAEDEAALEKMRARFAARASRPMPASNKVQALVPKGSTVFYNEWGTAPGFFIAALEDRPALLALPGPPREMQPMFQSLALPLLRNYIDAGTFSRIRTIHTFGEPESSVNDRCRDLFHADPRVNITILAKPYGIDLRLSAREQSEDALESLLGQFEQEIRKRLQPFEVYGMDEESLASAVGLLLADSKQTVTMAESCTGGLIAKMLTDVPGSSTYLGRAYVVYSNEAKSSILGVREATLAEHGAVSEEVAREMAQGVLRIAEADYALSVTGVAGPSGGTAEKPVGLTYIGLASRGRTLVQQHRFLADREQNRLSAAQTALHMLYCELGSRA